MIVYLGGWGGYFGRLTNCELSRQPSKTTRGGFSICGEICTCASKMTSLCRAASTCSFSAFACCIRVSLCVRATICAVPFTSSYCCCSLHTSISRNFMFGSSRRVVRTSNDSLKNFVQSFTALLISTISVVIVLARCSLTFGRVEGCAFNCRSTI